MTEGATITTRGIGGHGRHGRAQAVWLTPPELIAALGPFDLDPCFGVPRPWPTAAWHYGPIVDGLRAPWRGAVWCNPPYDMQAAAWLERCALHGNALALVFARTETVAFHRWVWRAACAVLFLRGRLHFCRSDGRRATGNAGGPSVIVAYGPDMAARLGASGLAGQFVDLTHSRRSA